MAGGLFENGPRPRDGVEEVLKAVTTDLGVPGTPILYNDRALVGHAFPAFKRSSPAYPANRSRTLEAEKLALSSEKAKAISSFTACLDESYRVKDEMGDKLSSVELQRQELQSKVLEAAILKNERIGEETVAKNKKLWGPMQGKDYTVIVSAAMKTLPHLTMEV
ncbi:hypothetical protein ACOSQ2_024347 [Xanthoceras sorbifolium]